MKGNIVVGQSGGPTAVINSSVAGVYAAAKKLGVKKVYGMVHGIQGFLQDNLCDLDEYLADETGIELLKRTPSAFLGSCRFKMPKIEGHEDVYEKVFEIMEKHDIECLFYAGGNDSMDTVKMLSDYAAAHNKPQRFMGVPKTIDNDIAITDHTPGYGSAARYLAETVAEVGVDVKSLPIHVCVVEAMGRNAGWITASSALARKKPGDAPHLIYLPERPFCEEEFLEDVKRLYEEKGGVVVVASEGLKDASGKPIVPPIFQTGRSVYYGDVSAYLAELVIKKLGIKARSEKPGICGRASVKLQSPVDRDEAVLAGREALKAAMRGDGGKMVGFIREETPDGSYQISVRMIPIEEVMLYEKVIPEEYINERGNDVEEAFVKWCKPLIGAEVPEYIDFQDLYREKREK